MGEKEKKRKKGVVIKKALHQQGRSVACQDFQIFHAIPKAGLVWNIAEIETGSRGCDTRPWHDFRGVHRKGAADLPTRCVVTREMTAEDERTYLSLMV
jgi:hypothetical protein